MARTHISSGSPFEAQVGYSRAVVTDGAVHVSGTCAPGETAAEQAAAILQTIVAALTEAGAGAADVVRTRIYLTNIADFEAVGAEHAKVFGDARPATTAVGVAALVKPEFLVEIEADAVLPQRPSIQGRVTLS
ncbi:RidA family protein [Micrococcales bacterium 31B]|nr:RidA family protein [Micrococcales bacterium 31B]